MSGLARADLGRKLQQVHRSIDDDRRAPNQAAGAVQDAYGKTVDAATEGAQTVKEAAIQGHDIVRKFVEDNPYTAAAIALGVGLLIGYAAHRPPQQRRYWWD